MLRMAFGWELSGHREASRMFLHLFELIIAVIANVIIHKLRTYLLDNVNGTIYDQ